jgi:hypothetical protein
MAAQDTELHGRSFSTDPDPEANPLVLITLTGALLATLFFTTAGIWLLDRYVLPLNDFQWTILILIPWVFFILMLTTALVFQVIRGVFSSLRRIRR